MLVKCLKDRNPMKGPEYRLLMNSFQLSVMPLAKGWSAECNDRSITALGATAEAAIQNARDMLYSMIEPKLRPAMLLVVVKDLRCTTIVMQPLSNPIAFEPPEAKPSWRNSSAAATHALVEE